MVRYYVVETLQDKDGLAALHKRSDSDSPASLPTLMAVAANPRRMTVWRDDTPLRQIRGETVSVRKAEGDMS